MIHSIRKFVENTFVLWVVVFAVLGWLVPGVFGWIGVGYEVRWIGDINGVIVGLGLIMFGMGMTITPSEITATLKQPGFVVGGVTAQYLVMPLLALVIGLILGLSEMLIIGVLILGCCPGGTASNVIAYLSRADVPLSVTVTLMSTALAPVATPWLLWWYSSYWLGWFREVSIEIPPGPLILTLMVIVFPLAIGLGIKQWGMEADQPELVDDVLTMGSVLVIGLIVAYVTGQGNWGEHSLSLLGWTLVAVVIHNLGGFLLGYGIGIGLGGELAQNRAISIEVGMQNSGLAVGLAPIIVTILELPEAHTVILALPGILFSVWHNVAGSVLATWWSADAR